MNAAGFPLLSLLTWLPLAGGLFILSLRGDEQTIAANARWTALWTSLIVFVLSIVLWVRFDPADPGFQFVETAAWLPQWGITYKMGVDGISVLFVLLSTLLTPICILASWESVKVRVREFMLAFLVLETMMVGMFCALDFVVFYMFFEGVLIPMYLIIGVWGGARRVYAAIKFFLYTLAGSVLMLLALLAMWYAAGTSRRCCTPSFRPRCRPGCSWPFSPRSRSRYRCGRCTPGCRTRMWKHPPRGRSSWPACC